MGDAQPSSAELSARWIQHGMRCRDQKQWAEALEAFDKAAALDTRNPQAWALKGRALDELNNLSEAIRCYKTSLELNPNSSSTWNNKGYAFRKQQKYNLALECYREAVRIQPGYAKAWYNMGYVLDKLGNYEASIEAFDHAIELAPDNEKYVASRKAVEATWREFQSVFDNSSVTSASSATTNVSSTSNSAEPTSTNVSVSGGIVVPISSQTSSNTSSSASHTGNGVPSTSSMYSTNSASSHRRRSGSAPNSEIPAHLMNSSGELPSGQQLNHDQHNLTITSQQQLLGGDGSLTHTPKLSPNPSIADFNPFLDFESSTLSLTAISDLTSSAPPIISRPTTPPSSSSGTGALSGTPLPPVSSSVPDSSSPMANALNSGLSPHQHHHTADFAQNNVLRSSQSALIGSVPGQGNIMDAMPVVLQPTGRMSLEEAHYAYVPHISHLRSSSHNVSNSSPALQLSHHADRHQAPGANSAMNHGARTPLSLRSANVSADDSSSSSAGSNGENGNGQYSTPQMAHSRSMSAAASAASPRGHGSRQHHSQQQQQTSGASQVGGVANGANNGDLNDGAFDASLTPSDANSLLNTLQQSMVQQQQQSSASTSGSTPMAASPEASDSEQREDRVHVGLPRARTYLEAIYSHLQNVKTVKDAEKLEKALEEMLAAVRVKRSFLNTKAENEDKCACCWERPPEMVCIPCGHLCICEECKYQLRQKKCPICSQPVKNIYKVFK